MCKTIQGVESLSQAIFITVALRSRNLQSNVLTMGGQAKSHSTRRTFLRPQGTDFQAFQSTMRQRSWVTLEDDVFDRITDTWTSDFEMRDHAPEPGFASALDILRSKTNELRPYFAEEMLTLFCPVIDTTTDELFLWTNAGLHAWGRSH